MTQMVLRPNLKTAGGEVSDILINNRFVGTLTVVYRESDRIAGSLQLEKEVLAESEKEEVFAFVHRYIQALLDAIDAKECEIMVTHSSFDHVIAAEAEPVFAGNQGLDGLSDYETDTGWVDHDSNLEDEGIAGRDQLTLGDYELVVVGEDDRTVEYHIYDPDENLAAEALVQVEGRAAEGSVNWLIEPGDNELDIAADLIVLDFDEDAVDTFVIHMLYDDEVIETIELTHENLLDEKKAPADTMNMVKKSDYSTVLIRDDGDVLTYEIFEKSHGGLPVGTATIDISQRQLSGFIDFREPGSEGDRELVATLLMEELDKEKDYEALHLSMMHRNRVIEEVQFETEHLH